MVVWLLLAAVACGPLAHAAAAAQQLLPLPLPPPSGALALALEPVTADSFVSRSFAQQVRLES